MKKTLISTAVALTCSFAPLVHADILGALKCLQGNCEGAAMPSSGNPLAGLLRLGQMQMTQSNDLGTWAQDFEAGQRAKALKDWPTAQSRTLAALKGMDEYGAQYPDRVRLYAAQQRVALSTLIEIARAEGLTKDAIPHMERLLAIEEAELAHRIASGNPDLASMTTADMMAIFKSMMEVGTSSAVYLNRRLITPEMEGTRLDEMLVQRLPKVEMTMVSLTEAYAEMGMREKAIAIFEDPFKRFLARQSANTNPMARQNIDVGVESACFRMAIALARLGPGPQADEAFACAQRESSKNYVVYGVKSTLGIMHDAAAERRRLFTGAYAAYVMAAESPMARQKLIGLVAETKGASNRYRERRRSIWTRSTSMRMFRARQEFTDHERRLTDMSLKGANYAEALAMWTNEEHALMTKYFEEFQRAGIQDVFTPGEQILARSQFKLEKRGLEIGGEEVLIGYSIYRPVDFKNLQLAPSRVLRYVVSKNATQVKDIGTLTEINQLSRQWRSAVVAGKDDGGQALGALLLGGLSVQARAAKSWVIDPDGVLSVLPFEALNEPQAGGRVIDRHNVRYVTSIAEFSEPSSASPPAGPGATAVIVADPVFSAVGAASTNGLTGEMRTVTGELLRNMQLKPLPETREEAGHVAAAMSRIGVATKLYTGDQATLDAFTFQQAPRYLHVATHGIFLEPGINLGDQGYVRLATALPGLQSALALSASDKGSTLTGADISRLNLRGTELVVFSACDTGNGEIEAGEGVASLRRSVEEAGAQSSITSLWPVPSKATATLMSDFYTRLAAGQSKTEALRQAKLSLMKSSPNPMNWAGFVLAGEP
ncbi:MAG: CHAT domain-containing protein [Hydrogenophaga sp.]|uniref:CHAT domain-containing protein n=1 Tax=Hydrogenophaga sp. TaxID=1904254 RepID=UPI002732C4E9|nr:CHAT domain-containing protein [Hydrogenophaga sp.]MDP3626139.1 CHAT domain-containing protein [Hydrogenophaga sp.]MDZ4293821.1 CHAT domain-containing protein [Hydrogenophaga sp.]